MQSRYLLLWLIPVVCGCNGWSPLAPLERSLIYHPAPFPEEAWRPPADLQLEDAWFTTDDGTHLHGWFVPHPRPRGVLLFAHGNAGNMTSRVDLLRSLHQRGLAVMTFDYRGYGRSDGSPSEEGLFHDARAARAWLAARTGAAEREIILFGRSLGGGVAVELAATDGARGLILASTFTSLPDVGAGQFPWLPTSWIMSERFDSLAKIADYQGPLLQCHGDHDELISIEQGQKLFAAAREPKRFVALTGGGHNAALTAEFHQALDEFLDALSHEFKNYPPAAVSLQ